MGNPHLRVLTVVGFPTGHDPGILDDLNRSAPSAYRWSTRAIMLDKTDATRLLTKIRRQWFAKRKSIAAILKEVMTNEASSLARHRRPQQGDGCRRGACRNSAPTRSAQAFVTATVTVWDDDTRIADESSRLVEKVIQGRDFTCMAESVNAVEAWLGSLPGHVYANVRQPPVSTLNLAHMIPLSAVWAGRATRRSILGAPPLFFGADGRARHRFGSRFTSAMSAHTLVVGPTGAGKSVLLALMAMQFRRYPEIRCLPSTLAARSARLHSPWAATGTISAARCRRTQATCVALQPLAPRSIDAAERAWAAEWIASILDARNGRRHT